MLCFICWCGSVEAALSLERVYHIHAVAIPPHQDRKKGTWSKPSSGRFSEVRQQPDFFFLRLMKDIQRHNFMVSSNSIRNVAWKIELGIYISKKKRDLWQIAANAEFPLWIWRARRYTEFFFYFNDIYHLTPPLYGDMEPPGFFASISHSHPALSLFQKDSRYKGEL